MSVDDSQERSESLEKKGRDAVWGNGISRPRNDDESSLSSGSLHCSYLELLRCLLQTELLSRPQSQSCSTAISKLELQSESFARFLLSGAHSHIELQLSPAFAGHPFSQLSALATTSHHSFLPVQEPAARSRRRVCLPVVLCSFPNRFLVLYKVINLFLLLNALLFCRKIRPCPSMNPGCISTNPKSSSFAFPWRIPDTSGDDAAQVLHNISRTLFVDIPVPTPIH